MNNAMKNPQSEQQQGEEAKSPDALSTMNTMKQKGNDVHPAPADEETVDINCALNEGATSTNSKKERSHTTFEDPATTKGKIISESSASPSKIVNASSSTRGISSCSFDVSASCDKTHSPRNLRASATLKSPPSAALSPPSPLQESPSTATKFGAATRKRRRPPQLPLTSRQFPNRFKMAPGGGADSQESIMSEEEEHRAMVSALFEIGMNESSPVSIFDNMSPQIKEEYSQLNLEKIKSKLQKFRKFKDKNKAEFLKVYDSTLKEFIIAFPLPKEVEDGNNEWDSCDGRANEDDNKDDGASYERVESNKETNRSEIKKPVSGGQQAKKAKSSPNVVPSSVVASLSSAGEMAAYLSHQTMSCAPLDGEDHLARQHKLASASLKTQNTNLMRVNVNTSVVHEPSKPKGEKNQTSSVSGVDILELPKLSQSELESPLGHAFQNFLGLYGTLMGSLLQERSIANSGGVCTNIAASEVKGGEHASNKPVLFTQGGVEGASQITQHAAASTAAQLLTGMTSDIRTEEYHTSSSVNETSKKPSSYYDVATGDKMNAFDK